MSSGKAHLFFPRIPEAHTVWLGEPLTLDEYKCRYKVDEASFVDTVIIHFFQVHYYTCNKSVFDEINLISEFVSYNNSFFHFFFSTSRNAFFFFIYDDFRIRNIENWGHSKYKNSICAADIYDFFFRTDAQFCCIFNVYNERQWRNARSMITENLSRLFK